MMMNRIPGMPKMVMGIVDVREVALAHLQALKVKEANMNRFILSSEVLWFKDIANILKEEFPNYKIINYEMKFCVGKMASFFIDEA